MNEWIFFAHKGVNPPTTICIHPLKTQNNLHFYIVVSVFWFIFLPCTCHRRLIRRGPELRDYLPPLSLHRWSVYDFWIKEELPGCVMDGQSTGAMADKIMWCIIGYQPGEKKWTRHFPKCLKHECAWRGWQRVHLNMTHTQMGQNHAKMSQTRCNTTF